MPDIVVEQSEVTPSEQQYYKESDLPGHLENPDGEVTLNNGPKSNEENKSDDLIRRDFQLYEAHTLLRGVTILSPKLSPKTSKSSATAE